MRALEIFKAFLAGFAATLLFHQPVLWVLFKAGIAGRAPYSFAPTKPFGMPSVISLAFWGGVWGILLGMFLSTRKKGWFTRAFIFGALLPTAVAMFVVMPLKGLPVAGGFDPQLIVGGIILNALWALGIALIYRLLGR